MRLWQAEATAWRRQRLKAEAIVVVVEIVQTIDAKVFAAVAWTPWLRFIRSWPVGARREEGLL